MQTVILSIVVTSHNSFDFRSGGSCPSYAYNCSLSALALKIPFGAFYLFPLERNRNTAAMRSLCFPSQSTFRCFRSKQSSFFKPAVKFSLVSHIGTRETPRINATFFGSIYGDFLYLGNYSNINNYNISFLFCQYICPKFSALARESRNSRRKNGFFLDFQAFPQKRATPGSAA